MNDKYSRTKEDATDVVIGGKVYRLTGADGAYLQEVASFLNRKLSEVRTANGYNHMDDAYRALLLDLNLADEYFKEKKETESCRAKAEEMEREVYSLKYELAATKMKLETALRQQAVIEERTEGWKKRYEELLNAQADLWKAENEQTGRSSLKRGAVREKLSANGTSAKKNASDAEDTDDADPGTVLSVQEWDAERFDAAVSPETKAETEAASDVRAAEENANASKAPQAGEADSLTASEEEDVLISSEQEVQETETQADVSAAEDETAETEEASVSREDDAGKLVENLRYGNALRAATRIDELRRSGTESYGRRERVVILPETERKKPRRRIIPEA